MCLLASLATQSSAQEYNPKVKISEFVCFLKNSDRYLDADGDIVVVNFSTCPNEVSIRDIYAAKGTVNVIPQPAGPEVVFVEISALAVQKDQASCLVQKADQFLEKARDGFVDLDPDLCSIMGYPKTMGR